MLVFIMTRRAPPAPTSRRESRPSACGRLRTPPAQLQQLLERDAHRQLEVAGLLDVAGDRRRSPCRRSSAGPSAGEPGRPLAQDRRHGGEALGVVDRRRRAVQAEVRRKRRLEARLARLALERVEQRRLFAADVGARADEAYRCRNRRRCPGCSCRAGPPRRPPASAASKRGIGSPRNSPRM